MNEELNERVTKKAVMDIRILIEKMAVQYCEKWAKALKEYSKFLDENHDEERMKFEEETLKVNLLYYEDCTHILFDLVKKVEEPTANIPSEMKLWAKAFKDMIK